MKWLVVFVLLLSCADTSVAHYPPFYEQHVDESTRADALSSLGDLLDSVDDAKRNTGPYHLRATTVGEKDKATEHDLEGVYKRVPVPQQQDPAMGPF